MATRGISLGRIIDWFRTCDAEEGNFALQRAGTILAERKSLLEPARSRAARAKKSHHKQPQPQPKDTRTVAEVIPEAPRPTESSETKAASAS